MRFSVNRFKCAALLLHCFLAEAQPIDAELVCDIPEHIEFPKNVAQTLETITHPPAKGLLSIRFEEFDTPVNRSYKLEVLGESYTGVCTCKGRYHVGIDAPYPYSVIKGTALDCHCRDHGQPYDPSEGSALPPGTIEIDGVSSHAWIQDNGFNVSQMKSDISLDMGEGTISRYGININRITGNLRVIMSRPKPHYTSAPVFAYQGVCKAATKPIF